MYYSPFSTLGKYRAKHDISLRCGIGTISLPAGAEVTVTSMNHSTKKVTIEFSTQDFDLYNVSLLTNNFIRV